MSKIARVLIVAGSDSGGGAGIQADIKTVTALGGFAATAITAITVQNTLGVSAVHRVPPEIVAAQIEAVLSDIGADIIKLGMLADAEIIQSVANALARLAPDTPLVLDPVMIAKGGHPLLAADAVDALKTLLVPRAALITPNAPEAAALTGLAVETGEQQCAAAWALLDLGAKAALVKGGHVEGPEAVDMLAAPEGLSEYRAARRRTKALHGTGCTLASAIATRLAQGSPLAQAVAQAKAYVLRAIDEAPGLGAGAGPLGHYWPCSSA